MESRLCLASRLSVPHNIGQSLPVDSRRQGRVVLVRISMVLMGSRLAFVHQIPSEQQEMEATESKAAVIAGEQHKISVGFGDVRPGLLGGQLPC